MGVFILGAGVSGLTCAVRLAEAGYQVTLLARDLPENTTSAVSGAIWYPYFAEPEEKVRAWAGATLRELQHLAREVPESGVRLVKGRKLFHRRMGPPWWRDFVDDFELLDQSKVGPSARAGYRFSIPVADTSRYLSYLLERFERSRGKIVQENITDFQALAVRAQIVVNCAGLGARELCRDRELFAIRGQVSLVEKGFTDQFLLDTDNPNGIFYVIPRGRDVVLGGYAQKGDESLAPREEETSAILSRCLKAFPGAATAALREVKVGLRPGRSAVRLEREIVDKTLFVHNYGHGGSGVTLSWGCADEVLRLLR